MKRWRWLEADDLVAMHGGLIAEFGGPPGLRDRALLESAAARPKHLATYERPTAFELAAAYAFGPARNHPFIDGNKRVALVAAFTFLELNGWEVQAEEAAAVLVFTSCCREPRRKAALGLGSRAIHGSMPRDASVLEPPTPGHKFEGGADGHQANQNTAGLQAGSCQRSNGCSTPSQARRTETGWTCCTSP